MEELTHPKLEVQDFFLPLIFPILLLLVYFIIKFIFTRFDMIGLFPFLSSISDIFSTHPSLLPNPVYPVSKTFNPFFLSLKSSSTEQLSFEMTTHCGCRVHILWGCLIDQIYPHINQNWKNFLNTFIYEAISLKYEIMKISSPSTTSLNLTIPPMELGVVPRSRYPLVVVMDDAEKSVSEDSSQNPNSIGSLISFVHLQDAFCPTSSHIFDQFVKTHTGQLHNIKPLFVSTSDEGGTLLINTATSSANNVSSEASEIYNEVRNRYNIPKESQSSQDSFGCSSFTSDQALNNSHIVNHTPSKARCVVCMEKYVERVILPCRHACVCEKCCDRLSNCPICRSFIINTFVFDE